MLELLDGMQQLQPKQYKSRAEAVFSRMGAVFLVSSIIFFVPLLGIAILVSLYQNPAESLSMYWLFAAEFLGTSSVVFALLSLALETASMLPPILLFTPYMFRQMHLEAENDLKNASLLLRIDGTALELTKEWLDNKLSSLENRLLVFVGQSGKIELIALAGSAWSLLNTLKEAPLFGLPNLSTFVGCFIGGAAIGSLLLLMHIRRLRYQQSLLVFALEQRKLEHEASVQA